MAKAKTKAAKIRAKRGRPRMEGVAREPSGRVSRSGRDYGPPDAVAIEARMRRMGLTAAQARDQKAATFIGYLNLIGRQDGLSGDQYDALVDFLDLRADYLAAIKAPNVMNGGGGNGSTDFITDAYVEWCKARIARYMDCRKAIQEAQNESRDNLWAAVDYCMIRDERHHHMIPALRVLGNRLHHFFKAPR